MSPNHFQSEPHPDCPRIGSSDDELKDVLGRFLRGEQARMETATRELRDVLIPQLKHHGVANIEAAYSGYGDSGAIDGVQYRDAAGQRIDRQKIPTAVHEALDKCLYEFLPAGFEINDGSQGTLTIQVPSAKVTIQHEENYTESRNSVREFDL